MGPTARRLSSIACADAPNSNGEQRDNSELEATADGGQGLSEMQSVNTK
jgi:hypothetical protein